MEAESERRKCKAQRIQIGESWLSYTRTSFLIEDDRYLIAMGFYIHGNPVRAGIVEEPKAYYWSRAWQ